MDIRGVDVTETAKASREAGRTGRRLSPGALFFGPAQAIVYGVVGWYLVSMFVPRLPVPHEVVEAAYGILTEPSSYAQFGATLGRVALGFVFGTGIGTVLGVAMGWRPRVNAVLGPLVMVALALPGAVTVIAFTLILGFEESSLQFALIFSVLPYVVTLTMTSVKSLDVGLMDMTEVFQVSTWDRWRVVLLPQLLPAIFAAGRVGFAVSWKFVVVIEAIATSTGVGAMMLFSFVRLQADDMIALALLFTVIMWTVESQVFARLEAYLFRWRGQGRRAPKAEGSAANAS
jgi:NitT/TauT family transport system permease protein